MFLGGRLRHWSLNVLSIKTFYIESDKFDSVIFRGVVENCKVKENYNLSKRLWLGGHFDF